jgi:hypothetical protein
MLKVILLWRRKTRRKRRRDREHGCCPPSCYILPKPQDHSSECLTPQFLSTATLFPSVLPEGFL